MDKRILKKIAKEWASGQLLGSDMSSFVCDPDIDMSYEEIVYIVDEVHKIAFNIIKDLDIEHPQQKLSGIIDRYYE